MDRKKAFSKNLFILSFGTLLPKLTAFITLPVITAALTKPDYGIYDLVTNLVTLLLPVITLQMQAAAFRFLIDCRDDKKKTDQILSNIVLFIVPIAVVVNVILYFVLFQYDPTIRLLICLYFFIDIMLRTFQQIVRGMDHNKLFSISAILESCVNLMLIVLTLSVLKLELAGVLLSACIADALGIAFLLWKVKIISRIRIAYINKPMLKELLAYSLPMVPNNLSLWILRSSDRIVLTAVIGAAANAVYAAATKIPLMLNVIQSAFTQAWQENASVSAKDKDAGAYYSEMFDSIFTMISGFLALLIMCTPLLFRLLIRGDYAEAYVHIPILMMGSYFSCISAFFSGIYIAHKRSRSLGTTSLVSALVNLAIDLAFVTQIHIFAASISTLVAYLVIAVYRMLNVRTFEKITYKVPKVIGIILFVSGMCVLCAMQSMVCDLINVALGAGFFALTNGKTMLGLAKKVLGKKGKKKE